MGRLALFGEAPRDYIAAPERPKRLGFGGWRTPWWAVGAWEEGVVPGYVRPSPAEFAHRWSRVFRLTGQGNVAGAPGVRSGRTP